MYPLMVIMMARLRDYFFETHWDLIMVKSLALIKASNWDYLLVECLVLYLGM